MVDLFHGFLVGALMAVPSFNLRFLSGMVSGLGVGDSLSLGRTQPFDRWKSQKENAYLVSSTSGDGA